MKIHVAFKNNTRDLQVDSTQSQDEVRDLISKAVLGEVKVLELADTHDRVHFINAAEIAYVTVDAGARRTVGFAGA